MKKNFLEIYLIASSLIVTALFIFFAIFIEPFIVIGTAMEPNYIEGDYLLANKRPLQIKTGNVVIFTPPSHPNHFIIAEVAADKPGTYRVNEVEFSVGEGELLVLDKREETNLELYGVIPKENVKARVLIKILNLGPQQ